MSGFATISNTNDEAATGMDMPDIDESKMQKAMSMLEKNMDKIDEDDPRQAAKLMRDLTSATGLQMGDSLEEALSRLEKGEDPEKIEQEMAIEARRLDRACFQGCFSQEGAEFLGRDELQRQQARGEAATGRLLMPAGFFELDRAEQALVNQDRS